MVRLVEMTVVKVKALLCGSNGSHGVEEISYSYESFSYCCS